jgi:hypothetical protein
MTNVKRYLGFVGILLLSFGIFMAWYSYKYSMDEAVPREINNPAEYSTKVLIATQGSEFKDAVLNNVISDLENLEYYIKVIDINNLDNIDPIDWNAICVIHTWEMWKAPKSVESFMANSSTTGNVIVMTTSGSGYGQLDGIDGLTSASVMTDVESISKQIVKSIKLVISNYQAAIN